MKASIVRAVIIFSLSIMFEGCGMNTEQTEERQISSTSGAFNFESQSSQKIMEELWDAIEEENGEGIAEMFSINARNGIEQKWMDEFMEQKLDALPVDMEVEKHGDEEAERQIDGAVETGKVGKPQKKLFHFVFYYYGKDEDIITIIKKYCEENPVPKVVRMQGGAGEGVPVRS